jgi:hypothetical protein
MIVAGNVLRMKTSFFSASALLCFRQVNWHVAWQVVMSVFYIALSVRLIQLILAFRGE